MGKLIIALIVIMAIIAGVGIYVGPEDGTTTPTPTATPTPTPTPTTPSDSTPAEEPETVELEPLPTETIALTLPGTNDASGTYEIGFTCELEEGRKVVGTIEWDTAFAAGWRAKIRNPKGASKAWNVSEQSLEFEYVATTTGKHSLKLINEKNTTEHTGSMDISGSWTQSEF